MPSIVILAEQVSGFAALVAMIGALVLASGLRSATSFFFASAQHRSFIRAEENSELFAESLYRPPVEAHGYFIAIGVYAAGAALLTRSNYMATALLAAAAFLFAWKRTAAPDRAFEGNREVKPAALRLARIAVPAVLVTVWALLDGVAHRNRVEAAGAAFASAENASKRVIPEKYPANTIDGYASIILWPYPEKKQIVPPVRVRSNLFGPGSWRPLIIRFDGPYYYFQPGRHAGSDSHQAQGSPLHVRIESNNARPLTIEAHQALSTPIPVAGCREIDIEVQNRDNDPGAIALAVLLRDSTAPRKSPLYLGQQPLQSTLPGHFSLKTVPVYETMRFEIPAQTEIGKFDVITIMVLPDVEHALVGPKIAIQQFELFPR